MKLSFDEALERINDGRHVKRAEVQAAALRRRVWLAEWHIPGCLSETQDICLTKESAIETCLGYAETEKGPPRGMKTALKKYGRFDSESGMYGTCVNTVSQVTLGELL
jgi:hypothetical protein